MRVNPRYIYFNNLILVIGMDDGTDNRVSEEDCTQEEEAFHDAPEFVSEVDNRYLSEDATVKEGKVELTEEQIKVTRQTDSIV